MQCGLVASKLGFEAGQNRGVPVTALSSVWLQKHLLRAGLWVYPSLLASESAWIATAVMKDFHLGMVERHVIKYCDIKRG